jgi:hypothetical protein
MESLYDSDNFAVIFTQLLDSPLDELTQIAMAAICRVPIATSPGFEIVDKQKSKEIFLSGEWARVFQLQIDAWDKNEPTFEEVEETLSSWTNLAQVPLILQ